ncbi:MAG: hypothetical protein WC612_00565 [Bdellovibrionales bacterium]|jgi:glutamate 5-kinase
MADPLNQKKTIVVKIGTEALSNAQGLPDLTVLAPLTHQLVALKKAGHAVVLVTSGAVGVGRHLLGWDKAKKLTLRERQVASKRGQVELMRLYGDLLRYDDIGVTQSLFERRHFGNEDVSPVEDVAAPLFVELGMPNIIPIINENDGAATTELRFTDNDQLAKHVSRLIQADTMIVLSNVDGVYTTNPSDPSARKITTINFCDPSTWQGIDTNGTSSSGLGGMKGKIKAAHCFLCGREGERACDPAPWAHWQRQVFIANSRTPNVVTRLLAGEEGVGTRLICQPEGNAPPKRCYLSQFPIAKNG